MRAVALRLFVAVLIAAATLAPAAGWAQTQERLDAASRDREEAIRELEAAAALRTDAAHHVDLVVQEYELATSEVARRQFAAAELETEIVVNEAVVRQMRARVERAVVSAYITGTPNPAAAQFDIAPGPARIVAERVAAARARLDGELVAGLADARRELVRLRERLDDERRAMDAARRDAEARTTLLRSLLADNEAGVVDAMAAVEDADQAYLAAFTALELEQRRLAALGGVLRWRPLVEEYFPSERVGEALRVMHCESRGNPDARHPGSDASGLFQVLAGTWAFASARAGFPGASRFDPEANVAAAAWLVDYSIRTGHPWGPWGRWTCRSALSPLRGDAGAAGSGG